MLTTAYDRCCRKSRRVPAARNKRIVDADFLNRSCAFDARLESKLLGQTLKILFRQHRSLAAVSVAWGAVGFASESGRARRQASYAAFSSSLRGGLAARFTCSQDSARKFALARRQALASRPRTDDRGQLERPSPLPCICD